MRAVKLGEAKLAWRDCGEGEGEKVSWQLESMDDLRKEGKVSSNGKVKTTVPLGLAGVPRPFLPFHSIHQGFAPGDARWGRLLSCVVVVGVIAMEVQVPCRSDHQGDSRRHRLAVL